MFAIALFSYYSRDCGAFLPVKLSQRKQTIERPPPRPRSLPGLCGERLSPNHDEISVYPSSHCGIVRLAFVFTMLVALQFVLYAALHSWEFVALGAFLFMSWYKDSKPVVQQQPSVRSPPAHAIGSRSVRLPSLLSRILCPQRPHITALLDE